MRKILRLQDKSGRCNDYSSIEIDNENEATADLYFLGDINSESLGEWQKYFPDDKAPKDVQDFLDQLDGATRINVHINSGGGSVFGGIAIYNILKRYNAEIVVYVEALAASIASVIAMAGDKIIIPANAQMMIHKPSAYTMGNADDIRKDADILDGCQKVILNTYMQHVKEGVTAEQINELINAETWKTGEEWQEFFDIEVSEANNATACMSSYFEQYKKLPDKLKKDSNRNLEQTVFDVGGIADALAERLQKTLQEFSVSESDTNRDREKQIEAILEDLDLI